MKSISKPFALFALAVACLLAVAIGQNNTATPAAAGAKTAEEIDNAAARQKLAKPVDKFDFKNTPLAEVIQYLRDASGANIFVKWGAMEATGIDRKTTVTIQLTDVTIEKALKYVLEDVGGGCARLGYVIDQGVVVISTMEDLSCRTVTKTYPVGDLINRTRAVYADSDGQLWQEGGFSTEQSDTESSGDSGGGSGGFFAETEDYYYGPDNSDAARKLMEMITSTVDPDLWRPNGETGCMEIFGTNLVITQTISNHEAIEQLLENLRRDRTLDIGVAVVRMSRADSQEKLDELVGKGGDVKAALLAGEKDGLWTLDRCECEQAVFGEIIAASQVFRHHVESVPDPKTGVVLELSDETGYELGVLARHRADNGAVMSVAYWSGWHPKGHDPQTDTPEKNVGVTKRHNVFDFTIAAGEVKAFSVIPFDVCGSAAVAVVWLPEAAKK